MVIEGGGFPESYAQQSFEELEKLYPTIGRLAFEAGPAAFRECWNKSKDLYGGLLDRTFHAKVVAAVEDAWLPMGHVKLFFTDDGKTFIQPTVPDYHKAGLRRRNRFGVSQKFLTG